MTDTKALRELINESGYKIQFIAQRCGLTYQGLLNKLNGESDFKTTEAGALKDLLGMSPEQFQTIFFANAVGK